MYRLLKTTPTRLTNTKHTFDEIKYVRRTKVRSLLQPVTTSTINTKSNFTSELTFNSRPQHFKSTSRLNLTLYSSTPKKKSIYNVYDKLRASRTNLRSWSYTYTSLPSLLKTHMNPTTTNPTVNLLEPQRILKQYSISTIFNSVNTQSTHPNLNTHLEKTYKVKSTLKPVVRKVTNSILNSYKSNFSINTNPITQLKIKTSRLSTFILRNIGVFILSKAL